MILGWVQLAWMLVFLVAFDFVNLLLIRLWQVTQWYYEKNVSSDLLQFGTGAKRVAERVLKGDSQDASMSLQSNSIGDQPLLAHQRDDGNNYHRM